MLTLLALISIFLNHIDMLFQTVGVQTDMGEERTVDGRRDGRSHVHVGAYITKCDETPMKQECVKWFT